MSDHGVWVWVLFNVFVLAMLAVDLGVFHRKQHAVSVKEALTWTGVWIVLAMLFNLVILFWGNELNLIAYTPEGEPMTESRTAVDFVDTSRSVYS